MIQITPHMRILIAVAPADFRKGIDGLASLCRSQMKADPMSGAMFVFRNRRKTAIRVLVYDGQGYWLCYKRLSTGKFRWWPKGDAAVCTLRAHELNVLLNAGNPEQIKAAPVWRAIDPKT